MLRLTRWHVVEQDPCVSDGSHPKIQAGWTGAPWVLVIKVPDNMTWNMETMKQLLTITLLLLVAGCGSVQQRTVQPRGLWTVEQANAWYGKQPWLVGCNFTPSTAINQLEMWQAETWDPATIDRELGWAQELGFHAASACSCTTSRGGRTAQAS